MRKKKSFLMRVAALAVAGVVSLGGIPVQAEAVQAAEQSEEGTYVLMNVPYADFYAAELNVGDSITVDGVSSATKAKPKTGTLVGGSYHVNSDGSDITGVTVPVKLGDGVKLADLVAKGGKQVTDADSVSITVSNRGNTSTTVYEGKNALFESASYSYYALTETPSCYKEVTKDENGELVFGEMQGDTKERSDVTAELSTTSNYGDYQLTLTGLDQIDNLYGVVIETRDADGNVSKYGLRHLENIWRTSNLAWSTGFTTKSHGNTLSYTQYESMMGQTITGITYYTEDGKLEIPVSIYVPVKFSGSSLSVEDAAASAESTSVTLTGLPQDYDPVYTVEGLTVSVEDGTLTLPSDAKAGSYTLNVSDASQKYVGLTASFVLSTDSTPVIFDQSKAALVAAYGFDEADLAAYVKNITSVTVDGTAYTTSGRGAVTIINADGTLAQDAAPFAQTDKTYTVTAEATGYTAKVTFGYYKAADTSDSKKDETPKNDTPVNTDTTKVNTDTAKENTSTVTEASRQDTAVAESEASRSESVSGNGTAAAATGQKKSVKKGDTCTRNKVTYQVTSTADGKRTVKVTGVTSKKLTEVTIPASVSIDGKSYKVTAIAKNAFAGCTKLTEVTIGKNVTSIGKSAFSGCSKLKTITIKSKVLEKVGSGAFTGIKSTAKIKVPSSKVKAYTTLLKGKGQGKKVTITK